MNKISYLIAYIFLIIQFSCNTIQMNSSKYPYRLSINSMSKFYNQRDELQQLEGYHDALWNEFDSGSDINNVYLIDQLSFNSNDISTSIIMKEYIDGEVVFNLIFTNKENKLVSYIDLGHRFTSNHEFTNPSIIEKDKVKIYISDDFKKIISEYTVLENGEHIGKHFEEQNE